MYLQFLLKNVNLSILTKVAINLHVLVDPKVDYIIVSSYEKESQDFEKKNSIDKDNFTSLVLSQLSKMETKAKNIFLIQGGFEQFAKKYPFLCVSFTKEGTSLINASLNYPFEVVPNVLFMGDSKHGNNIQLLKDIGISRVINVSGEKIEYPKEIENISLNYSGTEDEPIPPIDEAIKFIESAQKDEKTLIFCFDGKVKSCILTAAYILKDAKTKGKKINALYAWGLLEQCKPSLKVTQNYFRQLTAYEQELFDGIERKKKEEKKEEKKIEIDDLIE